MTTPILLALCFAPSGILLVVNELWRRKLAAQGRREPAPDKLLRPPGETARKKIEELDEKIHQRAAWFLGFPVILLVYFLADTRARPTDTRGGWYFILWASFIAFVMLAFRLGRLVEERNQWRLGFRGERFVAEELNKLMLDGCRVFHDFPLNGQGNLDHVVVAPSGVYAIETNTRTGRKSSGQHTPVVNYDGICLEFPAAYDSKSPVHAQNQAARLQELLQEVMDAPVPVKPILTLPGWYVTLKGMGGVPVLNPKMIRSTVITDAPPVLSPVEIELIASRLDAQCRSAEF
jgi:Nuclease-related domain